MVSEGLDIEKLNTEEKAYRHSVSPKMDYPSGKGQPPRRRSHLFLLCGVLAFMTLLIVGLVSYIDYGGTSAHGSEVDSGTTREIPSPGYPGSPVPEEQHSMESENAHEEFVVQEGQLHARSDNHGRRYTKEEQADVNELKPPPFKLPKLPIPIPSDVLDIPVQVPTHVSDIVGDLPPLPTIPTDPGDIIDVLPTDPAELIPDLPIPSLPPLPSVPTLPIPVPIPTEIPELPLPTILPPGRPKDPTDGIKLPDLTLIPHRVLGLLHDSISKLTTDDNIPRPIREILRLILRILNRLVGGGPVPKPKPPTATLPLPIPIPTKTKLPIPTVPTVPNPTEILPTLPPLPTIRPRPTLTLPVRAAVKKARDGGDEREPLSDSERKQLRDAVSNEVWASADWSNPILAPITAAGAMAAFDAVYWVAEAFKTTDDEAEKERLLGLLVVVDDDPDVVG